MATDTFHHHALLVADLERAVAFCVEAFDGRALTRPFAVAPPAAGGVMNGDERTSLTIALVAASFGTLELFRFADPAPPWATIDRRARLPHFGVRVDDVGAALDRVERAGGERLWDRVERWGTARVMYVADPDGNVIELLDADIRTIARQAARSQVEAGA